MVDMTAKRCDVSSRTTREGEPLPFSTALPLITVTTTTVIIASHHTAIPSLLTTQRVSAPEHLHTPLR